MSFNHGKNSAVVVGKFDLSPDTTAYNWQKTRQNVDVTTFAAAGASGRADRKFLAGIGEGSISVQGVWNPAVGREDENLDSINGAETVISAAPLGFNTVGERAQMVNGFIDDYQPRSPNNDAVRFSSGFTASAGAYLGVVLSPHVSQAAATALVGVDQSASSAFGAIGFVHVTELTSTGTAVVKVQDSADDQTYVDLITFPNVTAETSATAVVSGTVNRYVRADISGDITSITPVVTFHRHRL